MFAELTNFEQNNLKTICFGDFDNIIKKSDISIADLQSPLTNSRKK